jgi:putative transposase
VNRRKIVTKGKMWVVDRRTTRRYFLFRPDEAGKVEQAFWYCLAVCAAEYGIEVHAAVLMSTHIHLFYTDLLGNQPLFKREFHRLFACCIKLILGWPEEVFNKSQGGEHEPLTPEAAIEDTAYLIGNPPSAFTVRYARDWPGPKTLPEDIGRRVIRVSRPECFFDPKNPRWPEEAELRLTMPQVLEATYGEEEARRRIAERVRRFEREALAKSRKEGIAFRGARRVQRTPHTARARSYEVFGKVNPRFSAAGNVEAARRKVREIRQFNAEYDWALSRWMAGDRRVRFPHGTWWMRVHHGVRCRPPP